MHRLDREPCDNGVGWSQKGDGNNHNQPIGAHSGPFLPNRMVEDLPPFLSVKVIQERANIAELAVQPSYEEHVKTYLDEEGQYKAGVMERPEGVLPFVLCEKEAEHLFGRRIAYFMMGCDNPVCRDHKDHIEEIIGKDHIFVSKICKWRRRNIATGEEQAEE